MSNAEFERIAVEAAVTEQEAEGKKVKIKPLKPARSKAELTRVRQGWILISIGCLNVCLSALIAFRAFGLI